MRATRQKTTVTLITVALGTGKTSLLNRILKPGSRWLGVLMNEFEEMAIDCEL